VIYDLLFKASSEAVLTKAFKRFLRPAWRTKWYVVVSKTRLRHDARPPFAGPKSVLAYLSRYTHRVAISNRRLIKADATAVTFKVKNYRRNGPERYTTMMLSPHEFIRRFLLHVLPSWRSQASLGRACIASLTTVSSPTAIVQTTLQRCARSSGCRRLTTPAPMTHQTTPTRLTQSDSHVRAAAARCASLKSLKQAVSHDTS
jgi:hypothetical protein